MPWLRLFLIACPVLVLVALLAAWAATGFDLFGLSLPGLLALVGGAVLTSAVAIGLMALVFLSNRSGHDEDVGRPDPPE
ncbi:hypothetical protein [Roseomonas genomospecies 6]|uniref:Uncharacterized protein n=1 Tax=Roseomonas genomospecies 6 TaxID=214106 RepID=A0A9W7U093_9PROT|nr:hypothetical protein [Roseomonas genomospecies 6]KAA0684027.1 hypothetical protein DS843_00880 [Roseomonas genomospecies 6]